MEWAVGLITTPQRRTTLLLRTLDSLAAGGFERPMIFVDGDDDSLGWWLFGAEIVIRNRNIGNFGNWYLGMAEVFMRNPHAHRYIMFEDDIVVVQNLRDYLERVPIPQFGYCNLYLGGQRNPILARAEPDGWFVSDQRASGALALMFDRETVIRLLGSEVFIRERTNPNTGDMRIDGAICLALRSDPHRYIMEYVHKPSLVQHTGAESSILDQIRRERGLNVSDPAFNLSPMFPGEDFDAMTI